MDTQLLTESRFREILAWIEKDNCVKPEFADEFIDSLGTAFRRRSRAQRRERGCSGAMLSIGHILESSGIAPEQIPSIKVELESVQEEVVHDNGTGLLNDTGIDSLTLAKAVLHKVRSDRYQVTKSKIILISYVIYGVWLAEKHERVVHEHPQAWKYGPVFPRIYTKLDLDCDYKAEYDSILYSMPDLAGLVRHYSACLGPQSAAAISAVHTASGTPWKRCSISSRGKWGVAMDDGEIERWFSELIRRR